MEDVNGDMFVEAEMKDGATVEVWTDGTIFYDVPGQGEWMNGEYVPEGFELENAPTEV